MAAATAVVAAAAALFPALAPQASAGVPIVTLSAYPGFGCFPTSSGGVIEAGKILAAQLTAPQLVTTTAFVYRWNGTGWALIGNLFTPEGFVTSSYYNTVFGEVNAERFSAYVGHGYYEVLAGWRGS